MFFWKDGTILEKTACAILSHQKNTIFSKILSIEKTAKPST